MKFILLYLFLIPLFLVAQPNCVFNKTYDDYLEENIVYYKAIDPILDGYLTFGTGVDFSEDELGIGVRKIDYCGNVISDFVIDTGEAGSGFYHGDSYIKNEDGTYYLLVMNSTGENNGNPTLYHLDQNGYYIDNNIFSSDSKIDILHLVDYSEEEFLFVGWAQNYDPTGLILESFSTYLGLFNKVTNTIEEKFIGERLMPLSVSKTEDGGYLIGGKEYSDINEPDIFVLKVDSGLEQEWISILGGEQADGGAVVISKGDESSLLLWTENESIPTQVQNVAKITELNNEGEEVWTKPYYYSHQAFFSSPPLIYKQYIYIVFAKKYVGDVWENEFCKLDLEGNFIWREIIDSGTGVEQVIGDIKRTPDGGFIIAGFTYPYPNLPWIVKTDSLGRTCGVANCESDFVGIESNYTNSSQLKINPNPADKFATVELNSINLSKGLTLVFHNLIGTQIAEVEISNFENSIQVNTSTWPEGLYFCSVKNKNSSKTKTKFLVRH